MSASRWSRQNGADATASAHASSSARRTTVSTECPSAVATRSQAGHAGGRSASAVRRVRVQPFAPVAASMSRSRATSVARRRIDAPSEPGACAVRVEDRPRVGPAEPPRRVEALPEADVVDALGQDRLEVVPLGAPALAAQRAAGGIERVGEVDVGAGAHAEAGHLRMVPCPADPRPTMPARPRPAAGPRSAAPRHHQRCYSASVPGRSGRNRHRCASRRSSPVDDHGRQTQCAERPAGRTQSADSTGGDIRGGGGGTGPETRVLELADAGPGGRCAAPHELDGTPGPSATIPRTTEEQLSRVAEGPARRCHDNLPADAGKVPIPGRSSCEIGRSPGTLPHGRVFSFPVPRTHPFGKDPYP